MFTAVRSRRAVAVVAALVTAATIGAGMSPGPAGAATGRPATAPARKAPAEKAPATAAGKLTKRPAGKQSTRPSEASPASTSAERLCAAATAPGTMSCPTEKRTGPANRKAATVKPGTITGEGYVPTDLRTAYHLPQTGGKGAVIAVVAAYDDPNAASDLAAYRSEFGLPACTTGNGCFRKTDQDGGTDYPQPDVGWAGDISADLDMISAIAPKANLVLVEANSDSITDLGAATNEAVALGATYVLNSYVGPESPQETTWDSEYFDHPGVVMTAPSGDDGYGVTYPAASPYVTAVGGTELQYNYLNGTLGYHESVWDGSTTSGGDGAPGSGCSAYEPKPSWQTDTGCSHRTVTDVSADADPFSGVAVYDSYGVPWGYSDWGEYGGTDVAAAIITGIYALAGAAAGTGSPASYPYGAPTALNDVTSGNNGRCAPAYLCTAGPGYDGPTGLGTPDGIAAFMPPADRGTITGTVRNAATHRPVAGASVTIGGQALTTGTRGQYTLTVPAGKYKVAAADYEYSSTTHRVSVAGGTTVTRNIQLAPVPTATISGTVTDGSGHGWPLYATVQVENTPLPAVATNPVTGTYSVTVPANASYTLQATDPTYNYDQVSQQVTVGSSNVTQDFTLTQPACTAPGYAYQYAGLPLQTFDSTTTPSGWSVQDDIGNGQTWSFTNPGNQPNITGGTGNFATVNSSYYGASGQQDTSLVTPVIDLSSVTNPSINFDTAYDGDSTTLGGFNSVFDVDLSLDGGTTWTNVWEQTGRVSGSGPVSVPIPQAAGDADVQVRFHYVAQGLYAYDGWKGWQIDDVYVGSRACAVLPGGLLTGEVLDANTHQPLNGATLTAGGSIATSGTATSGLYGQQETLPAGLFILFVPAGTKKVTVSDPSYQTRTTRVSIASGSAASKDILLAAGVVSAPATLSGTVKLGGTSTTTLTLTNSGGAPATVSLAGQDAGFAAAARAGAPAGAAAGGPVRLVKGHYSFARSLPGASARAAVSSASGTGTKRVQAQPADSPAWTDLAPDPDAVADSGVASSGDGTVYSVGGEADVDDNASEWALTPDSWAYSDTDQQWKRIAPEPDAVLQPSTAFIGGKLYVIGGIGEDNPLTAVQIYDPSTNTWSTGTDMPAGRWAAGTAVLNGDIYVVAGCADASCTSSDSTFAYDPATGGWTTLASYPQAVSYLACAGISGTLYCSGGVDTANNDGSTATYAYNPQANAWTQVASLPIDLWGMSYATDNGQLLVSGGVTANSTELTNQGFAYDPSANTWSPLPNAGQASYRGAGTCGFDTVGGYADFSTGTQPFQTFAQLSGYGQCSPGVPWLSASSNQVTIPAKGSATVTVTLNAAATGVSQPGDYTAQLALSTDTPYQVTPVNVTMDVTAPKTWGEISGTVTASSCSGGTAPLPAATVQIDSWAGDNTLTTDADGQYSLWLNKGSNPLTILVSQNGYLAQSKKIKIVAGQDTPASFTLEPTGCG